jgi:hypothetical protein
MPIMALVQTQYSMYTYWHKVHVSKKYSNLKLEEQLHTYKHYSLQSTPTFLDMSDKW